MKYRSPHNNKAAKHWESLFMLLNDEYVFVRSVGLLQWGDVGHGAFVGCLQSWR